MLVGALISPAVFASIALIGTQPNRCHRSFLAGLWYGSPGSANLSADHDVRRSIQHRTNGECLVFSSSLNPGEAKSSSSSISRCCTYILTQLTHW